MKTLALVLLALAAAGQFGGIMADAMAGNERVLAQTITNTILDK